MIGRVPLEIKIESARTMIAAREAQRDNLDDQIASVELRLKRLKQLRSDAECDVINAHQRLSRLLEQKENEGE